MLINKITKNAKNIENRAANAQTHIADCIIVCSITKQIISLL